MIQREWQPVEVLVFDGEVDAYGQTRRDTPTVRTVDMVVKQYSTANVQNPKYADVQFIGLTKDTNITESNEIRFGGVAHKVLWTIPSSTYLTVLMR